MGTALSQAVVGVYMSDNGALPWGGILMRDLGFRTKRLVLIYEAAVEMAKITSCFPAGATGWTWKTFGVGGDSNFNLKKKKKK